MSLQKASNKSTSDVGSDDINSAMEVRSRWEIPKRSQELLKTTLASQPTKIEL